MRPRNTWAKRASTRCLGARPLRRLIQNEVEDQLSEEILSGRLGAGDIAYIDIEEGAIKITAKVPTDSDVVLEEEPAPAD